MILSKNALEDLVAKNISPDEALLLMRALMAGAQKAADAAKDVDEKYRSTHLGQVRHTYMNQEFDRALAALRMPPHPLCGSKIVSGLAKELVVVRLNIREGDKLAKCRSVTKRRLAAGNGHLRRLVEPELPGILDFEDFAPSGGTVIFLAEFPPGYMSLPSLYIAVPDEIMSSWLFRMSIDVFAVRHEDAGGQEVTVVQSDNAKPRLKKQAKGGAAG